MSFLINSICIYIIIQYTIALYNNNHSITEFFYQNLNSTDAVSPKQAYFSMGHTFTTFYCRRVISKIITSKNDHVTQFLSKHID